MSKRKYKIGQLTFPRWDTEISDREEIELIRKFQRLEGSLDCFTSAYVRVCEQSLCLWRDDCKETERHGVGYE